MPTSYEIIYERFLGKISDFDLPLMDDYEMLDYCFKMMNAALVKVPSFDNDLSKRSHDPEGEFEETLSELEIEVISGQMVVEWVASKINTTQLLHMFVGTKDESMASQANHIDKLQALATNERSIIAGLIRDYKYREWDGGVL